MTIARAAHTQGTQTTDHSYPNQNKFAASKKGSDAFADIYSAALNETQLASTANTRSVQEEKLYREQHAPQINPVAEYQAWLETDPRYITLKGDKPHSALLPENQQLIKELEAQKQGASSERVHDLKKMISTVSRFGDTELFDQNIGDILARSRSSQVAFSLKIAHLEIYNEPFAVPEGYTPKSDNEIEDMFGSIKNTREQMIKGNEEIGISRAETLARFKEIDAMSKRNLENFFFGWLNGIQTIENDPYLTKAES